MAGRQMPLKEYVSHFKLVNTSLGCEGGVPSSLRGPGLRSRRCLQVWFRDHLGVKVNRACDGCPEPLITHLGVAAFGRAKPRRSTVEANQASNCTSWRFRTL